MIQNGCTLLYIVQVVIVTKGIGELENCISEELSPYICIIEVTEQSGRAEITPLSAS